LFFLSYNEVFMLLSEEQLAQEEKQFCSSTN
jgi:hypothetical protein